MSKKLLSAKELVIKRSIIPNSGKGLFTKVFIPRGTAITEYQGKITTWKEADHNNGENSYLYYINKNRVIDARAAKKSFARYANDAKGLKKIKGLTNNSTYIIENDKKVFIKAMRDILPGSEILVGYGKEYWDVIRKNKLLK